MSQDAPPPPPPPSVGKIPSVKRKRTDDTSETSTTSTTQQKPTTSWIGIGSKNFDKSTTGYVGIANQGATCYLNSLIQTLFMTPEFRSVLYKWQYDPKFHSKEEQCIPLQLQKLFGRLQLSKERSVSTTDLTQSFGWTRQDSFVQHDVQELCRVLFEALDKTLTPKLFQQRQAELKQQILQLPHVDPANAVTQNFLVSDLYSGIMLDYIQAKDQFRSDGDAVGRTREDVFMDVQLVIRDVSSVQEALDNFIKPEYLTGDNQWLCDELGKKVDAVKGLKFKSMPYLLTLHLKRFDYDLITWQRIKLGNKVSFPFILDMSKYLIKPDSSSSQYELFSVLIHSGNARGGHYYAYIKSFQTKKWQNFNDSSVTEITEEDVVKMFGGEESDTSSKLKAYATSTNAYMLMYRLIDPARNMDIVKEDDVPQFIQEEIKKQNEEYEKERLEQEERKKKVQLRIFCEDLQPLMLLVDKRETFGAVSQKVYETISKEQGWKGHTADCVRLREINILSKRPGRLHAGKENVPIEELGFQVYKTLMLQTKKPDEQWEDEKDQFAIFVCGLNPETQDFEMPVTLRVDSDLTFRGLKAFLEEQLGSTKYPQSKMHVIKYTISALYEYGPDQDDKLIESDLDIKEHALLYVEALPQPDAKSMAKQKLEEQQYCFEIYYNQPGKLEYNKRIMIDKRKTIGDLRDALAKELNIPAHSFRMLDKRLRLPFKNDKAGLSEAGIFDCAIVHIDEGEALKETEHVLKIYVHVPTEIDKLGTCKFVDLDNADVEITNQVTYDQIVKQLPIAKPSPQQVTASSTQPPTTESTSTTNDVSSAPPSTSDATSTTTTTATAPEEPNSTNAVIAELYRRKREFKHVGKMVIDEKMTLAELKKTLGAYLGIPHDLIRVRSKIATIFGLLFSEDDKSMKDNYPSIADGKQLVIQILDRPETLVQGDAIIYVQQWFPALWKFGKRTELVVNEARFKTSAELKLKIFEMQQKDSTSPIDTLDHISIAKAPTNFDYWTQKECADIVLLNWNCESENIFARPFALRDVEYVFFKDNREPEKIPLEQLKLLLNSDSEQSKSIVFHGAQGKEQQLKIHIADIPDENAAIIPQAQTADSSTEKQ